MCDIGKLFCACKRALIYVFIICSAQDIAAATRNKCKITNCGGGGGINLPIT